jgi:hypothetical protein
MSGTPTLAMTLLQTGLLTGCVLVAQVVAVRHLPVESIPGVLRGRVALSNRLRPWLLVAAMTMVSAGLVLQVAG